MGRCSSNRYRGYCSRRVVAQTSDALNRTGRERQASHQTITRSWVFLHVLTLVLVACATEAPTTTLTTVPTATRMPNLLIQAREVFVRDCAICHSENAEGYANALGAPALDSTEHATEHPDQQMHDWIVSGKLGLGRQMPPYGDQLTDGEVRAVIAYLHTLWTAEQLEVQQDITSRYPATPEPTRMP